MIEAGTKFGRYEIRAKIGAGGMGEVYRARDEKLNRDVAIKVLPAALSQDADRLRRFEQEAQAAGALNHPNILAVYDVGMHDGSPYVVSELLEGETLKDRLDDGPISQRKAIDYAVQVAHGLTAAHEKGIVHRDLKPENLFITNDDRAKILDFGIAKLIEPVGEGVAQTDIATRKVQTDPGTVMGTVGYMSPEQVRGKHVDHRSDIFSFGAVLYEMLSGTRAFRGDSAVETLNAILKEEPAELSAQTNRNISPALERVIWHCLEKSSERRFQSARDLAFALEALFGSSPVSSQTISAIAALPARSKIVKQLPWIVAVTLLIILLAVLPFVIAYFRRAPVEVRTLRFSVSPPEKASLWSIAVSPDGRYLAFASTVEGKTMLWVRPMDSLTAQALPGSEGADYPFWSPDSRWIGFFAGGKLKKIDAFGGAPITLCDAAEARGGAWNREGVIIFTPVPRDRLYRVSDSGGEPTPVTTVDVSRQETSHRWPCFLPDGRHFIYAVQRTQNQTRGIYLGSLDGGETKHLFDAENNVIYVPPGYLLFMRGPKLFAQSFDASRLQVTAEPFPIEEQIGSNAGVGRGDFSASDNGALVYRSNAGRTTQLAWCDREGKSLGLLGPPANYWSVALSPDEKRVAEVRIDLQTGTPDIWVLELVHGLSSRLTFDPATDENPVWSPDGTRIVFDSNRAGQYDLYQKLASGAGNEEVLLKSSEPKYSTDWSRDGRFIAYNVNDPKNRADIWVLPLEGPRQPSPFLQTKFWEGEAKFSPDGRWLAYSSNESGRSEVYVQSFPASGGKWQISTGSGGSPRWRRDGKELFYLSGDNQLMAVEVKAGATFEFGVPKPLLETRTGTSVRFYDVTGDGQRFLIGGPVSEAAATPITVVINWTAGLKK